MINNLRQKVSLLPRISPKSFTADELNFIKANTTDTGSFAKRLYNLCNNQSVWICKVCNEELHFRDFKRGYGEFCSTKCSNNFNKEKTADTNLKKYGSTTWLTSPSGRLHTRNTCRLKYGTETYQQSDDFKHKLKQTWSTKDTSILIDNRKKHNLELYNCEYFFQTDKFKLKAHQTNLEKYGYSNAMQNSSIYLKAIASKQLNFIHQLEQENKVTLLDRYTGCKDYFKYKWRCNVCNSEFYDDISCGTRPRCFSCYPKKGTNIEEKIIKFLDDNSIKYILRCRKIISPYELDIVVPEYNVAIEINGLIWHSYTYGGKNKEYHINKLIKSKEANLKLISLYEDDILSPSKFSIIENRLKIIFNKAERKIFARKCTFKEISAHDARDFCEKNHLSGYSQSSHHYGLFYSNKLISVSTFIRRSSRKFIKSSNKDTDFELVRFCTLGPYIVVGGLSKLVKNASKLLKTNIFTYCDLNWGYSTSYYASGFKYIGDTGPGFYYIYNNKRYNRFHFAKFKQHKIFANYDKNLSERENCLRNGIDVLYNVGSSKFIYKAIENSHNL